MKDNDFTYGAFVLSVSGIAVRIVGALFKIPLTNLVGTTAMGYFSTTYSFYVFLLAFATSGLTTGVASITSRTNATSGGKASLKIIKLTCIIFVSFSLLIVTAAGIFADQIATLINSQAITYSIKAILPAVVFICVVSIFKGYFQGCNNMMPTAVCNLVEAIVKLIAGYGIAYYMSTKGFSAEKIIAGAIFGITISTFVSMIIIIIIYCRKKKADDLLSNKKDCHQTSNRILLRQIFTSTFPLMLTAISTELFNLLDSSIVVKGLQTYMTEEAANFYWGAYGNTAVTIFNLPSFLITSIGVSVLPSITAAYASQQKNDVASLIHKSFQYTCLLAFPCALGLFSITGPILQFFYGTSTGVKCAIPLLKILSLSLIPIGLTNVTSFILQGCGKSVQALFTTIFGASIKTILTLILIKNPQINIFGAPIATAITYPIMLIINIVFISKIVKIDLDICDILLKPLISGGVAAIVSYVIQGIFSLYCAATISFFISIICAIIAYFYISIHINLFTFDEIKQIFAQIKKST